MKSQRATRKMKRGFAKILLIYLTFSGIMGAPSVILAAGNFWTAKADMPAAMSIISTVVVNGKIYAIGGATEQIGQRARISMLEEYNPAQDTWSIGATIPTERINASISVANGKIYLIGGYDSNGLISAVDEYDPATNTWTKKADMPTARTNLSVGVVNNKIYAIGGEKLDGEAFPTVEEYDPVTDKWAKKKDMPDSGLNFETVAVNEKIYLIGSTNAQLMGGVRGLIGNPSAVMEYDPATDTWTQKADMLNPHVNSSLVVANGKIYVIGGIDGRAAGGGIGQIGNAQGVDEYDPAMDTWTQKTGAPTQQSNSAIASANGKIYVIGGTGERAGAEAGGQMTVLSTVMEYNPENDTWTQKADMPTARAGLSAATVKGKIYAIGGQSMREAGGIIGQMGRILIVEEYTPGDWQQYSVYPAGKSITKWGKIKAGDNFSSGN